MSTYFYNCPTKEELKNSYRELCKKHHPDRGGDTATMQAINAEYEKAIKEFLINEGKTKAQVTQEMEIESEFIERIQSIINIEGIVIELIGRWIWISGNTYAVKDQIKSLEFKWASTKKMWFWRSEKDASRNRLDFSIDEIRAMHGSRVIAANRSNMLAA